MRRLLRAYFSLVRQYNLPSSVRLSGLTCVLFFHSLAPEGRTSPPSSISTTLDYVSLYLLVDTELDNPSISYDQKRHFLLQLLGEEADCPEVQAIRLTYNRLCPTENEQVTFLPVLLTTAESFLVQYSTDATLHDLLCICVNKGGHSVLAGYRLIYPSSKHPQGLRVNEHPDEQLLLLGACIQLLDDLIDCTRDMSDGIETVATKYLRVHSCLDDLALLLGALILQLERALFKQRKWLLFLLVRAVGQSGHFSPGLRQRWGHARYKKYKLKDE